MNGSTKIIIGAVATALLAWGNHSLAGAGERFTGTLKTKAENAIAVADGRTRPYISFTGMEGNDAISRHPVVSGPFADSEREAILASIRQVPGISGASWAPDTEQLEMSPAENAELAEAEYAESNKSAAAVTQKVTRCQGNIDKLIASDTINFRDGSAYVNPAQNGDFLDRIAAELKACGGTRIKISGHTNTTGAASINTSISQARAEAVMAELVKRGVPQKGLTARGYGAERLKNKTNGAAAENRRIEFDVSSASAKPANKDASKDTGA